MATIGEQSRKNGQFNIAFLSNFVLGKLDDCLNILIENQRLPEAAFFCRTYLPSQISRVVGLWREKLKQMNMERAAQSLANPTDYENLFPGLIDTYKTEQYLKQQTKKQLAHDYQTIPVRYTHMLFILYICISFYYRQIGIDIQLLK
jgi:coatomer subunit beta'